MFCSGLREKNASVQTFDFWMWNTRGRSMHVHISVFVSEEASWGIEKLSYLCDKRTRWRPSAGSRRRSRSPAPNTPPGSDRGSRSFCSDPGTQVGPPGWSWPFPPGPEWRRSAARSECIPGSLSAGRLSHLPSMIQILELHLVYMNGWVDKKAAPTENQDITKTRQD